MDYEFVDTPNGTTDISDYSMTQPDTKEEPTSSNDTLSGSVLSPFSETQETVLYYERLDDIIDNQLYFQNNLFPLMLLVLGILVGTLFGALFISQWKIS